MAPDPTLTLLLEEHGALLNIGETAILAALYEVLYGPDAATAREVHETIVELTGLSPGNIQDCLILASNHWDFFLEWLTNYGDLYAEREGHA